MTYFASDSDQICLWKNIYVTPDVNVRTAHSAVHSLCEEKVKTVNGKDLIFDKCRVSSGGQSFPKIIKSSSPVWTSSSQLTVLPLLLVYFPLSTNL